jgi:U3 small nucleolar RNA-associated protein MPP10
MLKFYIAVQREEVAKCFLTTCVSMLHLSYVGGASTDGIFLILQEERTINLHQCEYEAVPGPDNGAAPSSPSEAFTAEAGLDSFARACAPTVALDKLQIIIKTLEPDQLLRSSEEMSHVTKQAVKEVVDYSLMEPFVPNASKISSCGFYVEGFDTEQVWLQLDAISQSALKHVNRVFYKSKDLDSVVPDDVEEALDGMWSLYFGLSVLHGDFLIFVLNADLLNSKFNKQITQEPLESELAPESDDSEGAHKEDNVVSDSDHEDWEQGVYYRNQADSGAVEDDYLNLDDMEAFLQDAEEAQARAEDGQNSGESDEEALDDLLDDMMNAKRKPKRLENGERDLDLSTDPFANAKYDDFFGPIRKTRKKVHFSADIVSNRGESNDEKIHSGSDEEEEFQDTQFDDDQASSDNDNENQEEMLKYAEEEMGLPSKHQMKLERLNDKIQRMEDEALGEKEWFMRGEISASHRPKNSALEIDLDFETTMKPPPQATEESTKSLEELIKQRIIDHRFDDVIAIMPSQEEKKRTTIELNDAKSSKGLGEIYEDEFMAAKMQGASEDKDEPIRELARKQFLSLCVKLDQLSHGQYKPVPSIEEVTFKVDVPAIMMEEANPAFVSHASMRKPEEVFRPGQSLQKSILVEDDEGEERVITAKEGMMLAEGLTKSEAELTREDRKRRRASKKRASKKRKMAKDAEQVQRALAKGKSAIPGRKSEAADQMLQKLAGAAKKSLDGNFTKSREVFARINDLNASGNKADKKAEVPKSKSMHLKL